MRFAVLARPVDMPTCRGQTTAARLMLREALRRSAGHGDDADLAETTRATATEIERSIGHDGADRRIPRDRVHDLARRRRVGGYRGRTASGRARGHCVRPRGHGGARRTQSENDDGPNHGGGDDDECDGSDREKRRPLGRGAEHGRLHRRAARHGDGRALRGSRPSSVAEGRPGNGTSGAGVDVASFATDGEELTMRGRRVASE